MDPVDATGRGVATDAGPMALAALVALPGTGVAAEGGVAAESFESWHQDVSHFLASCIPTYCKPLFGWGVRSNTSSCCKNPPHLQNSPKTMLKCSPKPHAKQEDLLPDKA